jgi:hypothetical protein
MPKRSRSIELGLVSVVAAAALSGCNSQQAYHRDWQQCVDSNNLVVEDRLCDQNQPSVMPYHYYHWLYTPHPHIPGSVIRDGYLTARPNMQVARSSGASSAEIARGGFGSSAHGSGGGE